MNKIKIKGINYDAGVGLFSDDNYRSFITDSEMKEAMVIIKNELHCDAVRIYSYDLEKLIECSHIAIREGLQVWFSPRRINASPEEMLEHIIKSSTAAEELRKISPGLIYVIGNEFTLDAKGFIEGETVYQRIKTLSRPISIFKIIFGSELNNELNGFLQKAVETARRYFKGDITYASGEWEKVDWDPFDIIGINYYRNIFNWWNYRWTIRKYTRKSKKFAVTEFGCCSYKGAALRGAWGYSMIDWRKTKPQLKKICERDENVQSDYLLDLLKIFSIKKVYAAFIYTYVARKALYNDDPLYDLDMANFGLIKVLPSDNKSPEVPYLWERKKAFCEVSGFYSDN